MADYTSIQIIKKAPNVWVFKDNLLPTDKYWFSNAYQDIVKEDLVSFTTRNGSNIYNREPYSIYSYIDELDSDNDFTPTSALDLHTKLVERGFFDNAGGGGGSTPTLQGLANSLFADLFGRGGQVVLIDDSELGFTTQVIDGLFQNNIPKILTFGFLGSGQVTAQEITDRLNTLYAIGNTETPVGFTVSETETPVVMIGVKSGVSYIYLFKKGKGTWGTTVSPVSASDLKLVSFYNTTPDDINPDDIIPLGTIADGDYVAQANLTEWNFSDSGTVTDNGTKQYFFSYTTDGVLYIVQFVGEPGIYGGEETPFTEEDFAATTNGGVTPSLNLQNVTDNGNTTSNSIKVTNVDGGTNYDDNNIEYSKGEFSTKIVYEDPEANIELTVPAKPTNDTFAMISDIKQGHIVLQADEGYVQSDNLKNVTIDSISADGGAYPDYLSFLTSFDHNTTTGEVTGLDAFPNSKILFHYTKTT